MFRKKVIVLLLSVLLLLLIPCKQSYAANNSLYRLEIGEFLGEASVNNALQQLQGYTGWNADIKLSRQADYYQVYSGGFYGEENVKNVLNQFKSTTGLDAKYIPFGTGTPYKVVFSGSYYGEDAAKKVAEELTATTGIQAKYQQNNVGKNRSKVFSGAYYGEDNVKQVLQEFQNVTGISATYEPTGEYKDLVRVESGGFFGEENVKTVVQSFQQDTGLTAYYKPIQYNEEYNVKTGGFYGEENVKTVVNYINNNLGLNADYIATNSKDIYTIDILKVSGDSLTKIENYLKQNNWWYYKENTGVRFATHFSIYTDELYDPDTIQKALQFFQKNNWWSTTVKTGNKKQVYFNIFSDSLIDSAKLYQALQFFQNKKLWATIVTTNEVVYPYYDIVTDPLLDQQTINKVESFFKDRDFWYTVRNTEQIAYTEFQIVTGNLLGEDIQKALQFFDNNNWWASSRVSGTANYYKIVTGEMWYDIAVAGQQLVSNKFDWWSTVVPISSKIFTNYNYTFERLVEIQSKRTPKADGTGIFTASNALLSYYMNPNNFVEGTAEYYQFMDLTTPIDLDTQQIAMLNGYLRGMGRLEGQAGTFYAAGKATGINPIYLIAHAIHETGKGSSNLSKGIQVNNKIVYNFFGYAAYDESANVSGAQYAYEQGWTSPEAAIMGGAANIAKNYIYRSAGPQNTLYKMRWNPINPGVHQYATHVAWVTAQTRYINEMYQLLGSIALSYDIPVYINQPGQSTKPTGEAQFAILPTPIGLVGYTTTSGLNIRNYPNGDIIGKVPYVNTTLNVIGNNGGWYKVNYNGTVGWVSGDYVDLKDAFIVKASELNVRSQPTTTSNIVTTLYKDYIVQGVVDTNGYYIKSGTWYKIIYNGKEAWVSGYYIEER
ncbi:SH3 domain-containing protein [Caldifermentibacillus hisashii]|mgnify:CR=1 FL=1|uniref:SH3 domain-containing protein n=1 Tax=Caldifermentibacillus hisashii TaxID=996558 RepID=UPI002E24EF5A|nr:SH3 domain-containing protein [Caldifermentibacillus hisashii]